MNEARRDVELYIRTTPAELWKAITNPERTRLYWYDALNRSTWTPGAPWTSESEDGELWLDGEILEVEPPHGLVQTFHIADSAEPPSKVTWQITPMGDACRLYVTHTGLGPEALHYVTGGWEFILSGLKTLLETGQPLKGGEPSSM